MSHFRVAVLHYPEQDIKDLLEPYDEDIEVPEYLLYTREQAIAKAREYNCNKDLSDEECWEWEAEGYITDSLGNIYSTYNPKSKWDYWTEIENLGRVGDFHPKSDTHAVGATAFATYAVVTPDGEWHAPGEVGWWGMSTDSAEDWVDWCLNYEERWIRGVDQDLELTIVDCHI